MQTRGRSIAAAFLLAATAADRSRTEHRDIDDSDRTHLMLPTQPTHATHALALRQGSLLLLLQHRRSARDGSLLAAMENTPRNVPLVAYVDWQVTIETWHVVCSGGIRAGMRIANRLQWERTH